jgi:hypothetical protein
MKTAIRTALAAIGIAIAACSRDPAGIPVTTQPASGAKLAFTVQPSNGGSGRRAHALRMLRETARQGEIAEADRALAPALTGGNHR